MAEHYFIPSREEANRFSEAYLEAQREYHEHLNLAYENGYEAGKKDATQKWISVKERLPDNFQSVLVRRKDGGIFIWMYSEESPTDDVWIDDYCNAFSLYDSTHWMPLPEPPKEVNDGN